MGGFAFLSLFRGFVFLSLSLVHVRVHASMFKSIRVCARMYSRVYTHLFAYVHVFSSTYLCMHVCSKYILVHTRMFKSIRVCTNECVCVFLLRMCSLTVLYLEHVLLHRYMQTLIGAELPTVHAAAGAN